MSNVLKKSKPIVQKNIQEEKCLPFEVYKSNDVFELEKENIFHNDWIFIGVESDFKKPGDYQALKLADEPIVIIRGKDGKLRALSNVCRHRGAILLKGYGNLRMHKFSCPYHAWTYSDQGMLKGVPYPGNVKVQKEEHCLPEFRLESFFGLIFISLNKDALPIQEKFKGLEKYFSEYSIDMFKYSSGIGSKNWQANWKLAMENFLEGYHFFAVHKETIEPSAPTKKVYYVEGHADWSVSRGKQKDYKRTLLGNLKSNNKEIEYLTICITPNFVANLYGDHMSWVRALPTGPTSCQLTYGVIAPDFFEVTRSETAFADKFFKEDQEICESVQEGMNSQHSRGGKLVELEQALVDFHLYLAKSNIGDI